MQEVIMHRDLIMALANELYDLVCQDVQVTRETERVRLLIRCMIQLTGKDVPNQFADDEKMKLMIRVGIIF